MGYQMIVEFTLVIMVGFAVTDQLVGPAAPLYGGQTLLQESGPSSYRITDTPYSQLCKTQSITTVDTNKTFTFCSDPARNVTSPQAFAQSQLDFWASVSLTFQAISAFAQSWFFAFTGIPHFVVNYLGWPAPIGWGIGIFIAYLFVNWLWQLVSGRSLKLLRPW